MITKGGSPNGHLMVIGDHDVDKNTSVYLVVLRYFVT